MVDFTTVLIDYVVELKQGCWKWKKYLDSSYTLCLHTTLLGTH